MRELKVAVIGAGGMAREHIRAFQDIPGASVTGIFNRTPGRARALADEFNIRHICQSVAELYEKTAADLVVLAVLETAVRSMSTAAFEYPWTVFMEKPPGLDLDDSLEIQKAARSRERRVLVGLNRRLLSSTQTALADLQSQTGARFIHVQDQQDTEQAKALGHPQAIVENWMYANSIHLVDYLRIFGRGSVTRVSPITRWNAADPQIVAAYVEFEGGDAGLYTCLWNRPGPWAVGVSTPGKRWELRPLEQASYQPQGERKQYPIDITSADREFKPGFRLQAEEVVKAALGQPSLATSLDDAIGTMTLISRIYTP